MSLRKNDTLYNILDQYTGENVNYNKVTLFADGTSMNDSKCDGVIYKKFGTEYFKRAFTGPVNVKWFGAKGDGVTDDITAIQAAVNSLPASDYPTSGAELHWPAGEYKCTSTLIVNKSIIMRGLGAKLVSSASVAIDLGSATYLTDLGSGYYKIGINGLQVQGAAGSTIIRNRGIRTIVLRNVTTYGGATALDTEGAWAGSELNQCRFVNTTGVMMKIRHRNNVFSLDSCQFINSTSHGVELSTSGAELKGVRFYNCDFEGCAGAVNITGNTTVIAIDKCHFENNTLYSLRLDNTAGTNNKYGISINNNLFYGADVLIGTDSAGTIVEGVTIADNEISDCSLIIAENVADVIYGSNKLSGTATKTIPASAISNVGACMLMPRYPVAPVAPWGTPAAGVFGDNRPDGKKLWIKTDNGWLASQLHKIADDTNAWPLPTGSTPNVTALKNVISNNSSPVSITSLTNGYPSQELIIIGSDGGKTTLVHGSNLILNGGVNFQILDNTVIHLVCTNGTKWVEASRSKDLKSWTGEDGYLPQFINGTFTNSSVLEDSAGVKLNNKKLIVLKSPASPVDGQLKCYDDSGMKLEIGAWQDEANANEKSAFLQASEEGVSNNRTLKLNPLGGHVAAGSTVSGSPAVNNDDFVTKGQLDAAAGGGTTGTTANDIVITDYTKGYVGYSPNGTRWRLTFNNDGSLTTTAF
jgi:hypothetical protein